MSYSPVTDPYLQSFTTQYRSIYSDEKTIQLWLITSPEYYMKRLLAFDSRPIYQISHSFRNAEYGQYHNPEFTILEWYQPFYSMQKFISKVDTFLQKILYCEKSDRVSYQEIFIKYLDIDPLSTNIKELRQKSKELGLNNLTDYENDLNTIMEILFSLKVECYLGQKKPIFVYNFPALQASLATINQNDSRVSDRFEIFFKGIELGNGFYELTDHDEQKKRFKKDNKKRVSMHLPPQNIDNLFLDALMHGLPPCSGIAIGLDRLIMIALKQKSIRDVISFAFDYY